MSPQFLPEKKDLIPEDSRVLVVLPLELKTFVSQWEAGKAGLGQESGNLPSLLTCNIQGVEFSLQYGCAYLFLISSLNLFWVKGHHIAWVKGHRGA